MATEAEVILIHNGTKDSENKIYSILFWKFGDIHV